MLESAGDVGMGGFPEWFGCRLVRCLAEGGAEVDLLSGAVDRRGIAVGDFRCSCQDLLAMSIVYKP